jgi:hypothetical protein
LGFATVSRFLALDIKFFDKLNHKAQPLADFRARIILNIADAWFLSCSVSCLALYP